MTTQTATTAPTYTPSPIVNSDLIVNTGEFDGPLSAAADALEPGVYPACATTTDTQRTLPGHVVVCGGSVFLTGVRDNDVFFASDKLHAMLSLPKFTAETPLGPVSIEVTSSSNIRVNFPQTVTVNNVTYTGVDAYASVERNTFDAWTASGRRPDKSYPANQLSDAAANTVTQTAIDATAPILGTPELAQACEHARLMHAAQRINGLYCAHINAQDEYTEAVNNIE